MPNTTDFDVFISYCWRDHAQVEALALQHRPEQALAAFEADRAILDFLVKQDPGRNSWKEALASANARIISLK